MNGRLYQFVAYSIGKNIPIGTIFFYSLNQDDSSVKMSVFFEKSVRGRVVVAESLVLAVVFALNIIKVQNIKFSVYPENLYMMNLAKKLKCVDCDTVNKQRNIKVFLLSSETISKILIVLGRLYR